MPTNLKTQTPQPKTQNTIGFFNPIRFLRAAAIATVLITLGEWLGFC